MCSSYPDIVSSTTSLAEQLHLQPVDVMEHFNKEVLSVWQYSLIIYSHALLIYSYVLILPLQLVSSLVEDLSNTTQSREWSESHR